VDTVPLEKLTAADPYDAVKSKPTTKSVCPASAGFAKVGVACGLLGADSAPGVVHATASNTKRKRFIAKKIMGGIILSLLKAALTIRGRIHVEGVDNCLTVGALTYRSFLKYSQRFRNLMLVNPSLYF